ncbi:unnamed protein product [Pseudo-nitzschia multistriata]|uniref:Uncharacterized protein n=1 Tax=Pseudo-nitzschia multistriata TaxID=183589 RepID=A0A448ZLZ8_9STRA|nr:unnamed protein product [Pseudo-nitzschia multistriata]
MFLVRQALATSSGSGRCCGSNGVAKRLPNPSQLLIRRQRQPVNPALFQQHRHNSCGGNASGTSDKKNLPATLLQRGHNSNHCSTRSFSVVPRVANHNNNHNGSRLAEADRHPEQQQQQRRNMARSSMAKGGDADPSAKPEAKALAFLVGTLGHERDVAEGVLNALRQSGVSGDAALLSMVRSLAGRWEVDEDAGLEALVESVTVELARSRGKTTVGFWVLPASAWPSREGEDDTAVEVDKTRAFWVEGFEDMVPPAAACFGIRSHRAAQSLTDVAKFGDGEGADVLGEMIECACSGIMACSTCHVVVQPEWFEQAGGEPSEAEQDMIDLAYNPKETSRLGCQVVLTPDLQNAVFKIPRGANNMMDFIPFEDKD